MFELFQHILDHAEDFDHGTLCIRTLEKFDFFFFFFLLAFIGTFDFADVFIGILQTKSLDVQFSVARIAEFGQGLEGERGKCNAFFERTVEAVGQPGAPRGRPDPHVHYIELHTAVIHSILT